MILCTKAMLHLSHFMCLPVLQHIVQDFLNDFMAWVTDVALYWCSMPRSSNMLMIITPSWALARDFMGLVNITEDSIRFTLLSLFERLCFVQSAEYVDLSCGLVKCGDVAYCYIDCFIHGVNIPHRIRAMAYLCRVLQDVGLPSISGKIFVLLLLCPHAIYGI